MLRKIQQMFLSGRLDLKEKIKETSDNGNLTLHLTETIQIKYFTL
jgi:hypothetical protein